MHAEDHCRLANAHPILPGIGPRRLMVTLLLSWSGLFSGCAPDDHGQRCYDIGMRNGTSHVLTDVDGRLYPRGWVPGGILDPDVSTWRCDVYEWPVPSSITVHLVDPAGGEHEIRTPLDFRPDYSGMILAVIKETAAGHYMIEIQTSARGEALP